VEPDLIKRVLAGRYADEENLVGIPWPGQMTPFNGTLTLNESVTVGMENMDAALRSTPGQKIAAGASGSTVAINELMLRYDKDPTAPSPDELSFVVMGDANRGVFTMFRGMTMPVLDYTVPASLDTRYDVLVVAGEYDGISDWPDRPWNLLAVLNALAATGLLQQVLPEDIVEDYKLDSFGSVHYDAMFADLDQVPEENITTTVNRKGGVTTSYLVPTADLPLLRPLQPLGVPQGIIDTLETVLRPIIDSAYIRNDLVRNKPPNVWAPRAPYRGASVTPTSVITPVAAAAKPSAATPTAAKPSGKALKKRSGSTRGGRG
jgi:hypothetical protein